MKTVRRLRRSIIALQDQFWYGLLFGILAVASGAFLFVELVFSPASRTVAFFRVADLIIAYLFLADFFVGVTCATKRKAYVKENWLNFLSSIPISQDAFRALRLLRFIRAVRTIRVAINAREALYRIRSGQPNGTT